MPVVYGVKFRGTGKVYYFSPGNIEDLQINDYVVVETVRGRELGRVAMPRRQVGDAGGDEEEDRQHYHDGYGASRGL